jgi:hypothetical protein
MRRELDEKKCLNMNRKPDRECEKRDDIILLYEIIENFIYWQAIFNSIIKKSLIVFLRFSNQDS